MRDRLAAASLARLQAPDPDPAIFQGHAAFALETFSPLTARPDQIKQLRQTILNLAVRGKLVAQDPADEPAERLLKKVVAETEAPLDLPENWLGVPVGSVLDFKYGKGKKASERLEEGPVPVFGSNGIVGFTDEPLAENPAIIIGRKGSAGALNLCDGPSWTTDVAYYVEAPRFFDLRYLFLTLQALNLDTLGKGVKPGLSRADAYPLLLGIPPTAEQHRIVAKFDELMALCDQLEQQQEDSVATHGTLVQTLLGALTAASERGQFEQAWQRIASHFDTLFTTESSIDQLKQTILQLAVMGKLVEQDPEDEPADKLLKEIAAKKARLTEVGEIKKQKALPEISEEEYPFELPVGWGWRRFEDLVNIQSGITKGRKLAGRKTITVPYLSVANVQRSYLNLENIKETQIPVEERQKYQISDRDLLITEGGDWDKVGRTAVWRDEVPYMTHQNHVFKARVFFHDQCVVWLEKYLNSRFSRDYFAGSSKQTTNLASINKTQLRGCIIAVPPHDEQSRIVAKVDELMALCDQLKANLKTAQTTQLNLAESLVEKAIR
jgi:type I restriction enzyme S subunit